MTESCSWACHIRAYTNSRKTRAPVQALRPSYQGSFFVGDVLFTRIVTAGGGSIMIGACPWVIPASWNIPIIDMRERWRPKALLTHDELSDYSLDIRADLDQGRQSQAQGLGQHHTRNASPRRFETRGRGHLRTSPSSHREKDRDMSRIGSDAGRHDGHGFGGGSRTASDRGRARTQALGRLDRHQGTGAREPNAQASREDRVRP